MESISPNIDRAGHAQVTTAPWEACPSVREKNHYATCGLVVSLLGALLGWVPWFGWLLWIAGLCFSLLGLMRPPRWSAVIGLIISVAVVALAVCISAIGSRAVYGLFTMMQS